MLLNDDDINSVAGSILKDYTHLFPSTYPDIPLNLAMLKDTLSKSGFIIEKNDIPDIMQRVELALAALVPLTWNNYGSIAILLNQQHPSENLLAMSEQRIIKLTTSLKNFIDNNTPDEDAIDSIMYTWISLTDADMGLSEEESWS